MFEIPAKPAFSFSSIITGIILSILMVTLLVFALERSNSLALAFIVVLIPPLVFIFSRRPDWIFIVFLFALLLFEEFPSGEGETLERSQRTTFYSLSLGIPGFYTTDLFLLVLVAMYLIRAIVLKERLPIIKDRIFMSLLVLATVTTITTLNSVFFQNAIDFSKYYDVSISGLGDFNQTAAALIGFFQIKIFVYLFVSYFVGSYFFSTEEKIKIFLKVFFIAAMANIVIGMVRLGLDPSIITERKPLFYHSPSTWIFAMTIFYLLGQWMSGRMRGIYMFASWIIIALLAVVILISFRRTMWGGIALCIIPFMLMATHWERRKIYLIMTTLVVLFAAMLIFTPIGYAVIERLLKTNYNDASSFYRLALFVYFYNYIADIPLLGYGVEPLWNYKDASMGFFIISLENIHSLYFWMLLRFGLIGSLIGVGCMGVILSSILKVRNNPNYIYYRWLLNVIILGFAMFLFSGIFNPVYGEARYMILMGMGLALVSRMPALIKPRAR